MTATSLHDDVFLNSEICHQKIFEKFRQGEEGVCIACWARWNAQLKGLVELEKKL